MNDLISQVQEGVVEREYPVFVALFMIIVIVIAILSFIIISQNKKINQLQKPKYGFLGKPLAVIMVMSLLISSYGIIFIANQTATSVTGVSADNDVNVEIIYNEVGEDNYLFKIKPKVNNIDWGNNPEYLFDTYWTFGGTSVDTDIELDLSMNRSGGIVKELKPGRYIVKVNVFFENGSYEKEIEVDLPI